MEGDGETGPSLQSLGQECEDWPVQRVIIKIIMPSQTDVVPEALSVYWVGRMGRRSLGGAIPRAPSMLIIIIAIESEHNPDVRNDYW